MKEGWEVRKLGDVCEINYGTRVVQKKDGGTIYPVYGGGGATFKMDRYNREDCIVVSRFAMSNQCVRYVRGKFFLNDSGLTVKTKEEKLSQEYLDKCIFSLNDKIYSLGKGVAQKNLDMKEFRHLDINYPCSKDEQSRIVEELDQLANIIEKKRQQLSELDNLAQSIFYDMFGDPIKASYTKIPLKELAENIGDGLHGTPNYSDDGDCYFINGNNLEDGKIVVSNSTKKVDKKEKDKYFIELNTKTILVSINGTLGKIAYYNNENVILGKSACYIKLKEGINKVYIYNILCSDYFKRYAQDNATGSTIRNVSLKSMRNLLIPIPPLEKQDDYMNKIEAIEKEKELIKQSIKETEELFNSRMDYYFG